MRTLKLHEIQSVSGATYSEDIMDVAFVVFANEELTKIGVIACNNAANALGNPNGPSPAALKMICYLTFPFIVGGLYAINNPEYVESLAKRARKYL